MKNLAHKILLPSLELTKISHSSDRNAIKVKLPDNQSYYVLKKQIDCDDIAPSWIRTNFNLLPVILNGSGAPWAEANIYLMSRIESADSPTMSTYSSIADSLTAYLRFLEESEIDWMEFPAQKLKRPTYRFHSYLKHEIFSGHIKVSTANRRISAVVSFYSWLLKERVLIPLHPPWKESDRYIQLKDMHGFNFSKRITTTDVSIKIPQQVDPYSDKLNDGGKLRPLAQEEQEWLIDALHARGNIEMLLIHIFGLVTGARLQTILTFRVRHARIETHPDITYITLPAGPGTDIDTKNNKKIVLHIPIWFYEMLRTYSYGARACNRRLKASEKDSADQYFFLSSRGAPLYQSKFEANAFVADKKTRYIPSGQAVRQYISEKIIPFIRSKYNSPNFKYQFHDTRATFGMNLTDFQLSLVAKGDINLHSAREFVKARMCHESSQTTDKYLQYRNNIELARNINADYEDHLHKLVLLKIRDGNELC